MFTFHSHCQCHCHCCRSNSDIYFEPSTLIIHRLHLLITNYFSFHCFLWNQYIKHHIMGTYITTNQARIQQIGLHGAPLCVLLVLKILCSHLGPTGPRCAPCWPHELCYLGWSVMCMSRFTKSWIKKGYYTQQSWGDVYSMDSTVCGTSVAAYIIMSFIRMYNPWLQNIMKRYGYGQVIWHAWNTWLRTPL